MTILRRQFLHLAAGAVALSTASRTANAQTYPLRPVRLIVGYPAGGVGDILARLIGQRLSERLGQPFIIENKPGANTNIATEEVTRSQPDGYTLIWITSANAINTTLYDNLNFNFNRDIVPVASLVRTPGVMEVNPAVPAQTVPEFIAYAKANPDKINFASGGILSRVSGELFKMMTGINMLDVPYRGVAPAMADLISGRVQVAFVPVPSSIEHIKAGRVRALGVTSATGLDVLPDIPTVAEFVPGYEVSEWTGIGVPSNTPAEIADKLNKEINAALADPKFSTQLAALGGMALPGSRADFAKLIADETEKWAKVIKFANITAE